MSKVTVVYNSIVAKMTALYEDKSRIPYPYSLPDNIDGFLVNGWGLKIGDQGNSEFIESCSWAVDRSFSAVFTREYVAMESDTEIQDDIVPLLLEDVYQAQKMFNAPDKMGINEILIVNIGSVSEVTEVLVGKRKYLSMEASFLIGIKENY